MIALDVFVVLMQMSHAQQLPMSITLQTAHACVVIDVHIHCKFRTLIHASVVAIEHALHPLLLLANLQEFFYQTAHVHVQMCVQLDLPKIQTIAHADAI